MDSRTLSILLISIALACFAGAAIISIILRIANRKERKVSSTSSAVKNRWNAKNYDRLVVQVPKGTREIFKSTCERNDVSMNAVLRDAVEQYIAEHQK